MDDIFNGLIDVGLSIQQVIDLSRNKKPDPQTVPGTWAHQELYIGGLYVIVARK